MQAPTAHDISLAARRLAGVARRTPLERSWYLSELLGFDVYLKLECWQRTRSFKIRGAYNAIALLEPAVRAHGVVTASAGNHGLGVALACQELGARAVVFVPAEAPAAKRERISGLGAELRLVDGTYDEAEVVAADFARERGAHFVHSYSEANVVAGQGTVGLEIIHDLPGVREIIVPVGGGGLIAGVGIAAGNAPGNGVRVLGVQSDRTRTMHDSFAAGRAVQPVESRTLADGLAGGVTESSYRWARAVVEDVKLVAEERLAEAMRTLYRYDGVVMEGSAAVAVAALLERTFDLRGPTVLVITGGNIDTARLAGILAGE